MESTNRAGMLVRVDHCIGCQACQVACREENKFGYDEKWMQLVRQKPQLVSGELRNYHLIAPQLDKCAACAKKDHQPLCVAICPTNCLYVGNEGALLEIMKGPGRWNLQI